MQTNWSAQHSEALREYVARGMSFSAIAKALNARFETLYSRNAALGRAKRDVARALTIVREREING